MRKHIKKILIAGALLIAFIFYMANYSYPAALRSAGIMWGLGQNSPRIEVFSEFNNDRIVVAHSAEGTMFAHVSRDRIFWRPIYWSLENSRNQETGLLRIMWSQWAERNWYLEIEEWPTYNGEESFESVQLGFFWNDWAGVQREAIFHGYSRNMESWAFEYNALFHGRNAIALIQIPQEKLPPGVAVRVRQSFNEYIIHLVSYTNEMLPGAGGRLHPLHEVDVFALIYEFIEN